jgi:DNA segregation ATPase FtsK/SpoIIIE, S-DNA-T family
MTADGEPKAASQVPKESKRSNQKRAVSPPVAESNKKPSRKSTPADDVPAPNRSKTEVSSASTVTPGEDGPQSPLERAVGLAARFQRFAWDVAGVLILAVSLMTLLALPGMPPISGGQLLGSWAAFLRLWLGYGSLLVVISGGLVGLLMLQRQANVLERIIWHRVFALEAAAICAWMLVTLAGGVSLERAEAGLDGGRLGWGVTETYLLLFGGESVQNLIIPSLIVGVILIISLVVGLGLGQPIERVLRKLAQSSTSPGEAYLDGDSVVSLAPLADQEHATITPAERKAKTSFVQAPFRKRFRVEQSAESNAPPPPRDERLPPLDLLVNENVSRPDERNINQTAGLIEQTLAEFGIPAKVVGFQVGPTVTQFAVEPGFVEKGNGEEQAARHKVRVAQISGLARDLALALSADRLRIEAPVPGRPYVGIEVPNLRSSVVRLRPILETEVFYKQNSQLSIALGRDVSGSPVVADLAKMPHMLIAGTTGSGKSVCIAALTTCLVMNNSPEDLRLVMIDPKMVELVRFNGLPHLYGKVETNLERILGVLRWTVIEMDRRYKLLEEMHARHLDSYNRKVRRRKGGQTLPRIVVMIDELADLMMSAPDQTEPALVRLAQLARATGIHLVVATQRPSTDVVTGLIKANFPARLSFAVASSVDSRVILDSSGAESLLGHGDMLFLPPDASAPLRSQGVMVTDQEVERVINFWQRAHPPQEAPPAPWEAMLAKEEILAERDDLVEKAIDLVRSTQRCSASLLQRRLKIGYPRAARLVDELEEMGVIGPSQGGGRERQVLIERDESDDELEQH